MWTIHGHCLIIHDEPIVCEQRERRARGGCTVVAIRKMNSVCLCPHCGIVHCKGHNPHKLACTKKNGERERVYTAAASDNDVDAAKLICSDRSTLQTKWAATLSAAPSSVTPTLTQSDPGNKVAASLNKYFPQMTHSCGTASCCPLGLGQLTLRTNYWSLLSFRKAAWGGTDL